MSTLLKALHRAQQPQPQTCIPAMGLAMPREEARTSRRLVWLLAPLALLLGAGANYGWHLIHLRPIEEKVEVKEVVTPPFVRVEPKAMVTRPLPPPLPEPVVQQPKVATTSNPAASRPTLAEQLMRALNETPLQQESGTVPQSVQPAQLMPLNVAPLSIRQQVPAFSYGSHVFSSNPAKRAVVLNGREYREGSEIAPGVRLATIAQEYMVLDVGGQSVTLKALQDWQG
ncbi:GspB family T2SS assembly factor variant ExeB [Aeromonas jandaei]|uniref:GspB family T2SS assembly factor variant ExeB n=1 Tax=Aeromonas jandaei TaxID=650 RepID=UPI0012EBE877|nr:GspB family T2SS assembly factor variant ExeB [Aeromonas jandaei]MVG13390.1 general secretion pathway protein GspB [Aeromonas jandaei]QSR74322.1 GspB family T2SS assembly factor variant ExeB [Aeromonas jandaei]